MPLRAQLDGQTIFAFRFSKQSWLKLKGKKLEMPCCGERAIPKTSKLGTQFFSHYRRGDCESCPESAEHLYLKNLVVELAEKAGWMAFTEEPGRTADGEEWVADVLCQKGESKLVVEIQWSHQTRDEFFRRQKKYSSSGVRAAWLFKLRKNKEYYQWDLPYEFETPVFGMKMESGDLTSIVIAQFNEPIRSFLKGMFRSKLDWSPRKGETLYTNIIAQYRECWRCKNETGAIIGIVAENKYGRTLDYKLFFHDGVPKFVLKHTNQQMLRSRNIGAIKKRFSHGARTSYVSNGCVHCDALWGNTHIQSYALQDGSSKVIKSIEFTYDGVSPKFGGDWYFDGKQSRFSF